jgi:flagellar basal-body rod protein FlgB
MATHASRRHAVISENIANADTPGYKAKDLKPFADIYTSAVKAGAQLSEVSKNTKAIDAGGTADPNGNTVSLEDQMLTSAQIVGQHDLAMLVYRKSLDMMKMAIGKNI